MFFFNSCQEIKRHWEGDYNFNHILDRLFLYRKNPHLFQIGRSNSIIAHIGSGVQKLEEHSSTYSGFLFPFLSLYLVFHQIVVEHFY